MAEEKQDKVAVELDFLIKFWEHTLWYYNYLLDPTVQHFLSQTIVFLKELKGMKEL